MDDNQNSGKNQPQGPDTPQPIPVEEVAPNVESPEQIQGSIPPEMPPDSPPVYEEKNNKFLFIGGILLFFIIVFGSIFWFFLKDAFFKSGPAEKVTLTYWGLWDEKAIYDGVIQEYQSKNPNVTINYEKMAPADYRDRLLARSKLGTGPDIFRFHNTWIPEIQEVVSPLPKEIMSNEEFEQTFYPIHQKDLKVEESYYGIPLMVDSLLLIYNDSLLKQAGLVNPPNVWVGENDVENAISKLTVRGSDNKIITSGMAIGTANNIDHFGEIFATLLILNGGDLKKLDQPEASDALELYRKFAEQNYWNEQMSNSIASFIAGKTAMVFGPSWQVINIKSQNPEMKVKVAAPPKGLNGSQFSISNYWVEGVNKFSKNQEESWKFLKYLSEKETMTKIYEQQAKVRPFGSAYSRRDLADNLKDNEYLSPLITLASNDKIVTIPVVDRTQDKGLNDSILQYIKNAINETANGVSYSEALRTAKAGIDTVLQQYKIQ
jgi:multiple sugar transport system substrate-binding protein